ncbi:MAG: FAD-binding oxidoreductase, partial [Paracoccaceae bacterium]|nr:FAD-binding oxidoreductase [Paracoccaceae bacterium]
AAFWADVERLTGSDVGYTRSGRLQPLADAHAVALARARALTAAELWQGKATWEVVEAGSNGWMPPSPTGLVVHDTLSALIHPRRATQALADAVVALGGEVVTEAPAEGSVVWATGWDGLREIGGNGVKGQAALHPVKPSKSFRK